MAGGSHAAAFRKGINLALRVLRKNSPIEAGQWQILSVASKIKKGLELNFHMTLRIRETPIDMIELWNPPEDDLAVRSATREGSTIRGKANNINFPSMPPSLVGFSCGGYVPERHAPIGPRGRQPLSVRRESHPRVYAAILR